MADKEQTDLEKRLESLHEEIAKLEGELGEIADDSKKRRRAVEINGELSFLREQLGRARRARHEEEERAREAEIKAEQEREEKAARVRNAMLELQRAALETKDAIVHIDPERMNRAVDEAGEALKGSPKVAKAARAYAEAVARLRSAAEDFDKAMSEV